MNLSAHSPEGNFFATLVSDSPTELPIEAVNMNGERARRQEKTRKKYNSPEPCCRHPITMTGDPDYV